MSSDLLEQVFAAHGGLRRWRELSALRARARCGGVVLSARRDHMFRRCEIMLSTREPWIVIAPFKGGYGCVTSERAWIESVAGQPEQAAGAKPADLRRAGLDSLYVRGQVFWRYLCTPFLLVLPGVVVQELPSWSEGGERWRRLFVRMPAPYGGEEQHLFYVDRHGVIRRHDCPLPGRRSVMTAHYCSRHRSFGGLLFPTRRRVFPRLPGGQVLRFPPLAWIDIDRVEPLAEAPDCD